jgi:5-formyltetrahydrofolate cyclo-ligase
MLKEELRYHYSELRRDFSLQAIDTASLSIANQFLSLPVWSLNYFHIFLQIEEKKEINTQYILSVLTGRDKNIVVPKVAEENRFNNYLLTDNTHLVKNRWGIPEPAEGLEVPAEKIDLVFLPLLAFDLAGHRVGYGRGFYDNFLANCRRDVIKVGLSLFEAEAQISDINARDIAMNYCLTPKTIYEF